MTQRVRGPNVGEPITSSFLKRLAANQNEMLEFAASPRDVSGGRSDEGDDVQSDLGRRGGRGPQGAKGAPGKGLESNETWRETSRTSSTVRVTSADDADVYIDVLRIETVTFARPGGEITLSFDNG